MRLFKRQFVVVLAVGMACLCLILTLSYSAPSYQSDYNVHEEPVNEDVNVRTTTELNTTTAALSQEKIQVKEDAEFKTSETPKGEDSNSPVAVKHFKPFEKSWSRSAVYGLQDQFVDDKPLFPSCTKKSTSTSWRSFKFEEPRQFLSNTKGPCWYDKTLKCAPYFYVPGVAKGGTTDIFRRLRLHPDVMQGTSKEYHWWERGRFGNIDPDENGGKAKGAESFYEYLDKVTGTEIDRVADDLTQQGYSKKVFGDGSPSYLWDVHYWHFLEGNQGCREPRVVVGQHIRHFWPPAKLIFTFRHPTPRLYSRFCSRVPRVSYLKKATAEDFHKFVVDGVRKYKDCFARWSIRQCAYNTSLFTDVNTRLLEGMYPIFMVDWLRVFPREQMFIMRYEDYATDVKGKMRELFEFLDLAPLNDTQLQAVADNEEANVGNMYDKIGPMLPETAAILNQFYEPFIHKFAEILNDKRFLWLEHS